MALRMLERLDESEAAYLGAVEVQKKVAADHPDIPDYQATLARIHNNLGVMYTAKNDRVKSAAAYQTAMTLHGDLANRYKRRIDFSLNLASSQMNWARHLQEHGKAVESLAWFDGAIRIFDQVLAKEPNHEFARLILHNSCFNRAIALDKLAPRFPLAWLRQMFLAAAAEDWRRVVELGEGQTHDNVRQFRPKALAYAGDHQRAMAALNVVVPDAPKPTPAWMFEEFAAVCGLCVAAAKRDSTLAKDELSRLVEQYAARSLEFLAQANSAGYYRTAAQIDKLKRDRRFEALRQRNDFHQFIGELDRRARATNSEPEA